MSEVDQINDDLEDEFKYTPEEQEEIRRLEEQNKNSDTLEDLDTPAEDTPSDDPEFDLDDETLADLTKTPIEEVKAETQELGEKTDTTKPDPEPEPEVVEDEFPDYTAQLEELQQQQQEAQGKVQDVIDQLTDLAQQFDDGEIGQGKYDVEKQRLDRELRRLDLNADKLAADVENLQSEADSKIAEYQGKAQQAWQSSLVNFLQQPENEIIASNVNVANEFDSIMEKMGKAGLFDGLSHAQILQSIRDRLSMSVNLPSYKVQAKTATDKKPETKPEKPTQTAKIPPSLTQTSALETPQDDPFAHIRKLKGIAYEDAIDALSPEQYDKFLFG